MNTHQTAIINYATHITNQIVSFLVLKCIFFFSVPPIIEAASPEMRINISEPAVLACLITGYPRPSITWKKNDEVFSTNTTRINISDFEVRAVDSGSGSIADLLRWEV